MKPGDFLLVTDKSFISKLIRWVTKGEWSHVAIVWKDQTLIEAVLGKGVRHFDAGNYINDPDTITCLYRIKGITDQQAAMIVKEAVRNLDTPYDLIGQIGVLIRAFCEQRGISFIKFWGRNKAENPLANWCSELASRCALKSGYRVSEKDPSYVVPQDFADSPILEIV